VRHSSSGLTDYVRLAVLLLWLGGCASLPVAPPHTEVPADPASVTAIADAADQRYEAGPHGPATAADATGEWTDNLLLAAADTRWLAQTSLRSQFADNEIEEYDPWEPFNEKMFEFNRWLDRWIIKPAAKGYTFIIPEPVQELIDNGFDNIRVVPRFVNSLLQGKFAGAGRELARFLINSTLGIGGLFDVAKTEFDIGKSKEDAGQTLGVWGMGPGPYLVLPFLPPLTVRDGIGLAVDGAMDPLVYVLPFIWDRFGMKVGDTVNDRAVNLDLYQGFEETTVEFYSALRNAYLQRRQKLIRE